MKTGLFIGRFQPFHNGHLMDIKDALKEVDKLIIAIGSSQYSDTKENPFSADERIEMIENSLAGVSGYKILLVPDINDDESWVQHVEEIVGKFDVVFTGNKKTEELFRKKGYKIKKVKIIKGINGTTIRDDILNNQNWKDLVSDSTVKVIEKNDGIERVKRVSS